MRGKSLCGDLVRVACFNNVNNICSDQCGLF